MTPRKRYTPKTGRQEHTIARAERRRNLRQLMGMLKTARTRDEEWYRWVVDRRRNRLGENA